MIRVPNAWEDTGGMQDVGMDRISWNGYRAVDVVNGQPYHWSHSKEAMTVAPLDYDNTLFRDGDML